MQTGTDDNWHIPDSSGQTVEFVSDGSGTLYNYGTLFIGDGANNNAHLKVIDSAGYRYSHYLKDMVIGGNGATGLFEYQHGAITESTRFDQMDTINIGSGLNSNGTMSLTGTGKNTSDQNMGNSIVYTEKLHIGTDGGTGELNIIGSGVEADTFNSAGHVIAFSLGSGSGSQGTMNILSGGKATISTGMGYSYNPLPTAVIGLNQGSGTLNIAGSTTNNGKTTPSRAVFAHGLDVGRGDGSTGTIRVEDGARLITIAPGGDDENTSAFIGVDNGKGTVLVSGENSVWHVSGHSSFSGPPGEVGHLSVGESGTGDLTIANGGKVSLGAITYVSTYDEDAGLSYYDLTFSNDVLGNVYLGQQAGSTGNLNFGAAEGEAAQAVGSLEANQIIFGAGNGSVVFNHTDNSGLYIFENELISGAEGQGSIKQVNGVTTFDSDRSIFTGKTYVTGGTLVANNVLGGTMFVSNGGTLAGIGNVGHTTVGNGGIISPGQFGSTTPEVLTIDGDLVMEAGSTYITNLSTDIDSSGTNAEGDVVNTYIADVIQVNGSATLNGAGVIAMAGGEPVLYVPDSRWRILSATGGVSGAFGPLESRPYVDLGYEYDADNAYLVVTRNEQDICTDGMTSNECNVGGNVDEQEDEDNDIKEEIVSQPDVDSAKDALNQLSGEIHASAKSALLEDSRFLREAINNRLLDTAVGTGAWGHIYTSWGTFDASGSSARMKRNIAGVILGVDKSLNDNWKMGLAGGYGKADIKVSDRSSTADRYDYHVGAYAKGQWGNFNLHTGVGYTWHDYTTDRYVKLQKLRDHLEADYNASTTQVFTEGRYLFDITDTLTVEPYIGAAYVHIDTDGFTERGGKAKLASASDNMDVFFTALGSRMTKQFTLENGQSTKIWSNIGWRHAYNDVTSTSTLNFSNANSFNVIGSSISRDAAIFEAGAEISVTPNTNIGAMYNGQVGNNTEDHGAKVYINWRF